MKLLVLGFMHSHICVHAKVPSVWEVRFFFQAEKSIRSQNLYLNWLSSLQRRKERISIYYTLACSKNLVYTLFINPKREISKEFHLKPIEFYVISHSVLQQLYYSVIKM